MQKGQMRKRAQNIYFQHWQNCNTKLFTITRFLTKEREIKPCATKIYLADVTLFNTSILEKLISQQKQSMKVM